MLRKTKNGFLSHFSGSSKHKRKWTDAQIEDMRARRLNGETWQSIGDTYNTHKASIYRAVQRFKPIVSNAVVPNGYIDIKAFMELSGEGYMAIYFKIKRRKINHLKIKNKLYLKHDTVLTSIKSLSIEKIEAIISLFEGGFSQIKIADTLGLHRLTVGKYVKLYKKGEL